MQAMAFCVRPDRSRLAVALRIIVYLAQIRSLCTARIVLTSRKTVWHRAIHGVREVSKLRLHQGEKVPYHGVELERSLLLHRKSERIDT